MSDIALQIKRLILRQISEVRTCIPAKIIAVNDDYTVDVEPMGYVESIDGQVLAYPRIYGVPLLFYQSCLGDVSITLPVKQGDNCLVLFSENDLANWRNNFERGYVGNAIKRTARFQMQDGIAIPGMYYMNKQPIKEAIEKDAIVLNYNKTSVDIRNGGISFSLGENKTSVDIRDEGISFALGENKTSVDIRDGGVSFSLGENKTSVDIRDGEISFTLGEI